MGPGWHPPGVPRGPKKGSKKGSKKGPFWVQKWVQKGSKSQRIWVSKGPKVRKGEVQPPFWGPSKRGHMEPYGAFGGPGGPGPFWVLRPLGA